MRTEAEDEWVQKEVFTMAQAMTALQKTPEDMWVRKEVHTRAQAWAKQQKKAEDEWVQKEVHRRAQACSEYQTRTEVEGNLNPIQNNNVQVTEVEAAEVNRFVPLYFAAISFENRSLT